MNNAKVAWKMAVKPAYVHACLCVSMPSRQQIPCSQIQRVSRLMIAQFKCGKQREMSLNRHTLH